MDRKYRTIVSHYEDCLDRYGDNHLGVDWPKKEDAATRYQVMLDVIRSIDHDREIRLLDFGCGASHLFEFIRNFNTPELHYSGLDLSQKFIDLSRTKFPKNDYYCMDLLEDSAQLPQFDYIVMNGVFTEKRGLSFDEMTGYFQRLLVKVFEHARIAVAFNVMSKHVDWEREDLFHLPFDQLAEFLVQNITRNFAFRADYELYEYTTYVYR